MKPALLFSFLGAAGCHAVLLFGFQASGPVLPSLGDQAPSLDVALVEGEPAAMPGEPDEAAPAPAHPEPEPAPEPEPKTEPKAEPEPQPTPALSDCAHVAESTPAPTPVRPPKPSPKEVTSKPSPAHRPARPVTTSGTGTGSGGGFGGRYFCGTATSGAGTGARPRYQPLPPYPPQARRANQEGVPLVKIEVGADGRPGAVSLARSSGFPLLDEAALRGVTRWRFEPARAAGVPVASQVEVPVRFSLVQ